MQASDSESDGSKKRTKADIAAAMDHTRKRLNRSATQGDDFANPYDNESFHQNKSVADDN